MRSRMSFVASLCVLCFAGSSPATEVINEDFEDELIDGNLIGTALIQDTGDGRGFLLSLTQGINSQVGFAWLDTPFNLRDSHVEIEFDFYIRTGTTNPPADGMSVIFQFGDDTNATGGAGGGLGTCVFRGDNSPYVSVAFDIWDNRESNDTNDPNLPPCYDPASTRSCHVEVNQNICPGADPSTQTNGALGVDAPDFTAIGDTLTPIHAKIIFDNGLIEVYLQTDGDPNYASPVKVISVALAAFPDPADSIIGFAASTGGANAYHEVDNVIVDESPSKVTYVEEAPRTSGAINCGGPAVDATAEIGLSFVADRLFGAEASRTGDLATGLTITRATFGRVSSPPDNTNVNPRTINFSQIPGAGPQTVKLFADDAWSTTGVHYQARVVPGRYDVSLYWAENFAGAIDGVGRGTKLFNVFLNGSRVLCNWSAAAAAGSITGSGDPSATCTAVLDTAIRRTFSLDVPDAGGGFGVLDVVVDDLGGGNPPENAALHALSFNRSGNATGAAVGGDIQCIQPPPGAAPAGVLFSESFDDTGDNECPASMSCQGAGYVPQALASRLRVTEDLIGNTAASANFLETVDVSRFSFKAEFDVYMTWEDDQPPADGGAFYVLEGANPTALGVGGGGEGIPLDRFGFAVEFDTWDNGPTFHDTSGFNGANAWTHVGINNMSYESTATNTDFDPNLKPVSFGGTGWVDFRHPDGAHVVVTYNAGHVEVELTGTTDDGSPFGPAKVVEADVPPILGTEATVGFSGGTGGANQTLEFDNVEITAAPGKPGSDPVADAFDRARARWDNRGELYINCGGPLLACRANQNPATGATGDASVGEEVVWVPDLAGGGSVDRFDGDFFSIVPLEGSAGLQVAGTDMGTWDARGTAAGIDSNDLLFQTERWSAMQYEIPAPNNTYEVTLYFANSFSGTAGTAQRVFHVEVQGERRGGFQHCQSSGKPPIGPARRNPFFGFDELFDPVDEAESLYSSNPCNFVKCGTNGVIVTTDPDGDRITAQEECGNAAASALRYEVEVTDGLITIALTPPDVAAGEPASPDTNPKISGISIKRKGGGGVVFHRGDADDNGQLQLTDAIRVLGFLFLGQAAPTCLDAGDADDNGQIQLTDAIRILGFLFLGGPPPATPGPPGEACGPDPTAEDPELGCAEYTNC